MSWEEEHAKRVAGFPADLREAHKHSSNHRKEVEASAVCGCFYCLSTFPPAEIGKWTDKGQTALCPKCGIDSVIGDRSGFSISTGFLASMRSHWF
jgi:hypothetical protein